MLIRIIFSASAYRIIDDFRFADAVVQSLNRNFKSMIMVKIIM